LKKKNKVGGVTLPNFKTYYKATEIVYEYIEKWTQSESQEGNPYNCGQLKLSKGGEPIQWGKCFFLQNVLRQQQIHIQNSEAGPLTYTMYKIHSK
jgi:hypothetical protein